MVNYFNFTDTTYHFHGTLASRFTSIAPFHPSKLSIIITRLNKIKSLKRCRDSRRAEKKKSKKQKTKQKNNKTTTTTTKKNPEHVGRQHETVRSLMLRLQLHIFNMKRYIWWGYVVNCFMLLSPPFSPIFCCSAIPISHQTFNVFLSILGWWYLCCMQFVSSYYTL